MGALSAVVWQRIEEVMLRKGLNLKDLKQRVRRNKNTYTNWYREPRPVLRISDLEDLARALGVAPADLVTIPDGQKDDRRQLVLPFEDGLPRTSIELEYTGTGLVIRRIESDHH